MKITFDSLFAGTFIFPSRREPTRPARKNKLDVRPHNALLTESQTHPEEKVTGQYQSAVSVLANEGLVLTTMANLGTKVDSYPKSRKISGT